MVEIVELKKHILNYSRTRETCVAYRKAGYSKKCFEAHREALTLHRAAKKAFNELGMARLPRIKDLNAEYARVLSVKKQTYAEYREARAEMRAFAKARRNVETFLELEKKENDHGQREKNQEKSTFDHDKAIFIAQLSTQWCSFRGLVMCPNKHFGVSPDRGKRQKQSLYIRRHCLPSIFSNAKS